MNTPSTPAPAPTCLGLDIAKRTLDLSAHPALPQRAYANDAAGHAALVGALHQAQVPVTLVNPRHVRDFARAKKLLAKTDALDAAVLAEYGRLFQPAPTVARTPAQARLGALVTRRQELLEIITQEQHRAEHHHEASVLKKARSLRATLRRHLEQLEEEIAALEKADAVLTGQVQRLTGIQGVGQRTAWLLLAALPELGTLRPWPDWLPTITTADRSAGSGTSPTDARWPGAPSTWRPWSRRVTTRCCGPFISACGRRANRPNSPSSPSCANSPNSPTSCLKALPLN
jgi:hypothetical protein